MPRLPPTGEEEEEKSWGVPPRERSAMTASGAACDFVARQAAEDYYLTLAGAFLLFRSRYFCRSRALVPTEVVTRPKVYNRWTKEARWKWEGGTRNHNFSVPPPADRRPPHSATDFSTSRWRSRCGLAMRQPPRPQRV